VIEIDSGPSDVYKTQLKLIDEKFALPDPGGFIGHEWHFVVKSKDIKLCSRISKSAIA
jgi:hypothetical protein